MDKVSVHCCIHDTGETSISQCISS